MLEFKITEQNTIRVDNSKVVADFTKFIEFKLELPENWQGLTVNGLFYREEDETLGMVENIVSGEVRNLPSAPFKGEEFGQDFKVFISFVGTGADGKTATSSVYELTVQPSGLSGMNVTPEGDEENPFARFLRLVEEERKKAEAAAKTAAADAIEQLQPSIDEIIAAAGSASESAKSAVRSENAAAGSEQSAASDAAKAAQDRAAADQAAADAEAAKQAARESAIAAAASQAAAAESEKKTEADAAKTGQDRAAAEQAASDAAAAKETAIQKAEAAEQSRLKAAESEQTATGAAEQSNVQAEAAERAAEAAQAAKKTAEEKARAATQSEQAAANSAAVCAEAGEKVSRAEAAAVRAEQAADSIQEAVDANNAAQAAKTETISAKNATIAASQTAQLEAQKVQQIVAGNEAYTKTESDLKYTVAPRKEASSNTGELKLTDADEGLSYLALQGNSEQYTNTANKNLIDLHLATDGYYVNNINGVLAVNPNYRASTYIEVIPGESYFLSNASQASPGAMYNANKVYVQGVTKGLNVIPDGVKYVRISANKAIQIEASTQFEKGTQGTEIVIGAVDTPSPEYPSEVRSVGDIPKDVNGVEIRNLLPNESIENLFVYEDTKDFIYLKLAQNVKSGVYCAFSASATTGNGLYCRIASKIPSWGPAGSYQIVENDTYNGMVGTRYSYSFTTPTDLYVTFTRATLSGNKKPDKALIKQFFEKHTIMITEAAEIDEYRPYIGENNGLVKLESIGVNRADTGDGPISIASVNNIEVNTWTPRRIVLTQKNKANSFAYAKLNIEHGKNYTFYCKAKVEIIDGTATYKVTNIGFRRYPISGSIYGKVYLSQDGQYHDIYNETGIMSDDVSNMGFIFYLSEANAPNGNVRMTIDDLMVVEGKKTLQEMQALKFQPYYQQITWIPLREPLRGIRGDDDNFYADTIDKDGNVTQNIYFAKGKDMATFNTDASGINTSDNPYKWAYWVQDEVLWAFKNTKSVLCNMLKRGNFNVNQMVISNTQVIVFNLPNTLTGLANTETDKAAITAAIKAWVNTNNPLVYYVLNTPITYQISAVYIETHDPETNIRCLNKVKPSDMTLDYKIAMSSLIKRLEALEEKTVQEV